nr:MAG TPA: hypothetical protein [Caudoviricetes sp.]
MEIRPCPHHGVRLFFHQIRKFPSFATHCLKSLLYISESDFSS